MTYLEKIIEIQNECTDLESFLDRTVIMVAESLNAEVCSIYLFNETTNFLTLRATHGLSKDSVGRIMLHEGEGLVGTVFKESAPICLTDASKNKNYKFFSYAGEEPFDAFLAMPILRAVERIGVLVVQRGQEYPFSKQEIINMKRLTVQLASATETVRALFQIKEFPETEEVIHNEFMIKGHSASDGYARGPSVQFRRRPVEHILKHNRKSLQGVGTSDDLKLALTKTTGELKQLQVAIGEKLPEVASLIFESHMMMLKDSSFTGGMFEKIEVGIPANRAIAETANKYIKMFESSSHDYMKEKAKDVEDLALRLLLNISKDKASSETSWNGRILIARELLPSDILKVTLENVAGIIQVGGGLTSHISLLVRSLNIPMVIIDDITLLRIPDGEILLLDAYCSTVFVNPSTEVIDTFKEREKVRKIAEDQKEQMSEKTLMLDNTPVRLMANINLLSELDLALDLKAEGVGLYRTEFPFLIRQALPTEEEQYSIYTKLFKRMSEHDVTIRTLDAGGDKVLSFFDDAGEANPALGLRSTRLTLRYREVFNQQIRAILRAGATSSSIRIMFPMISSLDEFFEAKQIVLNCINDLETEGITIPRTPEIGMMVELPAVLEIIDELAQEVDFFSIGTNDFIQYTLAADRTNERVSDYYCPHHPAILRGLKRIADAAIRHNTPCSVCGEMAHDTRFVPFFIGIGIRQLSIDPHYMPDVQKCIMKHSSATTENYAHQLLNKSSINEIEALLVQPCKN